MDNQLIGWAIFCIPYLFGTVYLTKFVLEKRSISRLQRISERFLIVRQATNDFMSTAVSYLDAPLSIMSEAVDKVSSQNLASSDSLQSLKMNLKELTALVNQSKSDNEASAIRAETHGQPLFKPASSIWKSIWLWAPLLIIVSCFSALALVRPDTFAFAISLSAVVLLLGIAIMILSLQKLLATQARKRIVERQTALTVHLFDIRRDFIKDLYKNLHDRGVALQHNSQEFHSIPHARGIFKGVSWLEAISNRLERAYDASNLTEDPPLYALSTYLERALANEFKTMAAANHISIESNIDKGLAFRISPGDFSQLMSSVVDNAITYSKPGGRVVIRGKRRSHKIHITVADEGVGIDDEQMAKLFQPSNDVRTEVSPPALNLHINKIIMARVGGELKLSSRKDKGTVVTIVAKKNRSKENFKIPRHVLRSTGVLE